MIVSIFNDVLGPVMRGFSSAANALSCAKMTLAGYAPVIPLDKVIETAKRVSAQMPREFRCTALGGLSMTPPSLATGEETRRMQSRLLRQRLRVLPRDLRRPMIAFPLPARTVTLPTSASPRQTNALLSGNRLCPQRETVIYSP